MKIDFDSFREIGDALVRNRSRSLLTGFGIFWGLFMLLFLKGGGTGLVEMLGRNFDGFASNTTIVFSSTTTKPYHGFKKGRYWSLETSDIDYLKMMIPELDVVTPTMSRYGQTAEHGINTFACNVKGVYPDYAIVEIPSIKYGRYINEIDCMKERKVCVIGGRVYKSLFPEGGDPCGTFIKVGSLYYQIIGVDTSSGNINIQGSADQSVLIPMTLANKIFNRGKSVDVILMTGKDGVRMSTLEPRLREVLAHRHQFDSSDKQALWVLHMEQIFQIMDNLFKGVNFLILLVGLGTILAGAIGVSNIMMVTVKERTTEIGIRRAIGATPFQILSQIIMESVTLTMVAGSAGIVFSVAMLEGLQAIVAKGDAAGICFQVDFKTAVLSALLLAVLGVVAGLAPASRAMGIKPVDAMRDE